MTPLPKLPPSRGGSCDESGKMCLKTPPVVIWFRCQASNGVTHDNEHDFRSPRPSATGWSDACQAHAVVCCGRLGFFSRSLTASASLFPSWSVRLYVLGPYQNQGRAAASRRGRKSASHGIESKAGALTRNTRLGSPRSSKEALHKFDSMGGRGVMPCSCFRPV